MKQQNQLTMAPIPKLIRQIAIPASIGFFFNTMYNVVDTYFGGLISTQVQAALSLSFPIFFIIIAMGSGMATGTTALIATAIGEGNLQQARLFAVQGIAFGVILSFFLTVIGLLSAPFLFSLLGASESYLEICLNYMNTIFFGAPFFMLTYMLNTILNALGNTKPYRNFLVAGFFLNLVFDPWFIYGGLGIPPMRTLGIAIATVLIQLIGSIYLGTRVFQSGILKGSQWTELHPRKKTFQEIARQGFPASANTFTVGLGIFVITYFISKFGKEAVAGYGIATRVEQIALLPTIGLNIATLTIVAQNNGARLFGRIHEAVKTALLYGGAVMSLGTAGVFMFAENLMGFFTQDPPVIEHGTTYLKIASFVLYAYTIMYINIAALQGIKKPMFAIWTGLYRQIVAPIIVFYALIHLLDLGIKGIWWGIFSVTWSATGITLLYSRRLLRKNLALCSDQRV